MISVLGCDINVIDKGTGAPILFLHGNPDSSHLWESVASSLSASHRSIVPDLPGFGRSTSTLDFDYTLNGLTRFMEALYSGLGIREPVYLVGHDFGGTIGAAWMAAHPERVRSFTVSNSAFTTAYPWHFWARIWRMPLIGELSMLMTNRLFFGLELRRGSPKLTRDHIDATYALYTPSVQRTVLKLYRAVRPESFNGWEQKYLEAAKRIPVLVLWGEDDPYVPTSFAETFGAKRVVKFPSAGHWLPAVEPRLVLQELSSFVSTA